MGPKVKDTADKGSDRAGVGMSTAGMANLAFFWVVKVSVAKVAKGSCAVSAVAAGKVWLPIVNVTSWRRKGWLAVPEAGWVCSPGRRRKKKPRV